jgi:hypothetical protein
MPDATSFARLIEAMPVVDNDSVRAATFPNPALGQRVHNRTSGYLEYWDGSDWLGEVPTGRGAHVFDVRAYGAKCDGITDDLVAVNKALAACLAAGGGIVLFPKGICLVSATPTYPVGVPIRLVGAGRLRSIIKHKTGGTVLSWTFSHVATEFGGGIEDLSFDGNGGAVTAAIISNPTLFCVRRVTFTNSNGIGTGLNLTSAWDSEFANVYVQDAGDATHPAAVLDTLSTGGFNGNSFNNCQFHDFHVELSGQDCIFLDVVGNATNDLDGLKFFGLKLHGNAATSMPNRPLLRLSQYTNGNTFVSSIIAYGKGTSQVEDAGTRNTFITTDFGVGGPSAPTYAVQCTATCNGHMEYKANVKTPNAYGSVNKPFRVEAGSIHNRFLWPDGNFAAISNPLDDQGGRSTCLWDDLASNRGAKFYFGEGFQWVGTQVMDPHVDLTWGAAVAVPNFQSRKYFLAATTNIAATVSVPTSPPQSGQAQRMSITFANTSGGALTTAIAFSAAANGFKVSGTVSPANNTQITVDFDWNGSFWVEASRSAAVPT